MKIINNIINITIILVLDIYFNIFRLEKDIKISQDERNYHKHYYLKNKEKAEESEGALQRTLNENITVDGRNKHLEDKIKSHEFKYNTLKKDIESKEKEYDNLKNNLQQEEKKIKYTKPVIDKKIVNEEKKIHSIKIELE